MALMSIEWSYYRSTFYKKISIKQKNLTRVHAVLPLINTTWLIASFLNFRHPKHLKLHDEN